LTGPIRLLAGVLCAGLLAACEEKPAPRAVAGGDAAVGKRLVGQYQCGACHVIPEVAAAQGRVGPPLAAYGRRAYIAGGIPNQPEALVRWLVDPPAMKPGTGMPNLGVSADEARHMAAYLYSVDE
jgi:cytochrome c2